MSSLSTRMSSMFWYGDGPLSDRSRPSSWVNTDTNCQFGVSDFAWSVMWRPLSSSPEAAADSSSCRVQLEDSFASDQTNPNLICPSEISENKCRFFPLKQRRIQDIYLKHSHM